MLVFTASVTAHQTMKRRMTVFCGDLTRRILPMPISTSTPIRPSTVMIVTRPKSSSSVMNSCGRTNVTKMRSRAPAMAKVGRKISRAVEGRAALGCGRLCHLMERTRDLRQREPAMYDAWRRLFDEDPRGYALQHPDWILAAHPDDGSVFVPEWEGERLSG